MDVSMNIAIGADHAGFALKQQIAETLRQAGHQVIDEGTDSGVILLSDASPTYYDSAAKCQVYEHEHFSELGDALVALALLVKEPTP